jgi:hypothetical protein
VVNGGVDQGVRLAAIFGLHMKHEVSKFEIRVVTEDHGRADDPWCQTKSAAGRVIEPTGERCGDGSENLPEHLTGGVSLAIITLRP